MPRAVIYVEPGPPTKCVLGYAINAVSPQEFAAAPDRNAQNALRSAPYPFWRFGRSSLAERRPMPVAKPAVERKD